MKETQILIDGYNLLKVNRIGTRAGLNLEHQREHLLKLLKSSPRLQKDDLVVIFDGTRQFASQGIRHFGRIKVIFSDKNKEADDIIREWVRKESSTKRLKVVSSDNEIRNAARDHGAETIRSETFWEMVQTKDRQTKKESEQQKGNDRELSAKEVEEWLQLFRQRNETNEEN